MTQELQKQGVPLSLNGVDLVDKALHVIQGESGGNPDAVGDGGAAHGLFQSHYVGEGASTSAQIADAVKLIAKNPAQWTDWGEGTTYNGASFGALGRTPYGSGAGSAAGSAVGSAIAQQQASTPATAAISQTAIPDTGNFGLPFSQPATDVTATAGVGGPAPQQDFSQALAPIAPLSNTPDIDQQAPGALRQQAIDQGAYNNRTFPIAQRLQNQAGDVGAAIGGVIPDFSVPRNAYDKGISYEDGTQKSPSLNISPRELGRGYAKTFVPASETEFATYGPMMAANIQGLEPLSRLPGAIAGAGRSLLETGGGSIIRNEGEQAAAGLTGEAAAGANAAPERSLTSAPAPAPLNPKSPEAIAGVARDEAAAKGARLANIDVSKTEWTTPAEKDAAIATALDTHLGGDTDVTLYRGTNPSRSPLTTSTAADEGPGKWWTTDAKVAEQYAGPNGEVQKAVVKASDLADPEHANPIGGPNSGEWTLSKDLQNRAVAPPTPEVRRLADMPPEPPQGYVRMYRGQTPYIEGAKPHLDTYDLGTAPGRWFSSTKEDAEWFAKRRGGEVYAVDVPRTDFAQGKWGRLGDRVGTIRPEANPDIATGLRDPNGDYIAPPELAQKPTSNVPAIPNAVEPASAGPQAAGGTALGGAGTPPAAEPPLSDLERQMQASLRGAKPATSAPKTPAAMRQELEAAGVNTEGKTVAQVVSRYRQFASESGTTATPIENVSNVAREAYNKTLAQTGDLDAAKLAARKAAAQEGTANARAGALSNMLDTYKAQAKAIHQADDALLDNGLQAGVQGKIGQSPLEKAIAERRPTAGHIPANVNELPKVRAEEKYLRGEGTAPEPPPPVPKPGMISEVMGLLGAPQTVMASADAGQIFRQASVMGWTRPTEWKDAAVAGLKAFASEESANQARAAVESSPWYNFGKSSGLHIYDWGGTVTDASERVPGFTGLNQSHVSKFLGDLPPVKNSERSFATKLNTQGMFAFEEYAQNMWESGVRDEKQYKDLAQVINPARGYSDVNPGQIIPGFNTFFSGRNMVSRLQILTDPLTRSGSLLESSARQLAAKNLAGFLAGNAALLGVIGTTGAMAGGAWSVNADPFSSDFAKIKVGNTRIDTLGGFAPLGRLIIREAAMASDAVSDNKTDIAPSRADWRSEITKFFRNKEAPIPSMITDELSGKDSLGRPVTFGPDRLTSMFMPFIAQDVVNAYTQNQGANKALAIPVAGLSALGAGTSTYQTLGDLKDAAAVALPPDEKGRYPTKNGQKATSFNDLMPQARTLVENTGAVQQAKAQNPTPYQIQSEKAKAPTIADTQRQEALFAQGQNDTSLRDVYKSQRDQFRGIAQALEPEFAKTLARFNKDTYDKAVEGYYSLGDKAKNEKGDIDFDKLASLQNDYVANLPADQQQWVKETLQVSEDKKSDTQKGYDQYVAAKKAAGYFDIDPSDPKASQKRSALDMSHANIDEMGWKYGSTTGKPGGALNSPQAVQLALADPFSKNMPVKFQGLDRAINQSPQIQQLWQDQGQRLADYGDTGKLVTKFGNQAAQELYNKPYAQLSLNEQSSALARIRAGIRDSSPSLQALLIYMGDNIRNNEITVPNDAAVVGALKALQSKYGIAPPKLGVKYVPAKN